MGYECYGHFDGKYCSDSQSGMWSEGVRGQIFLIFWMAAAVRFLIPVQLPLKLLNVRCGLEIVVFRAEETGSQAAGEVWPDFRAEQENDGNLIQIKVGSEQREEPSDLPRVPTGSQRITGEKAWFLIWAAGAAAVGACFLTKYIRYIRKLHEVLPAEDLESVKRWRKLYPRSANRSIWVVYTDYYDMPLMQNIVLKIISCLWRKAIKDGEIELPFWEGWICSTFIPLPAKR